MPIPQGTSFTESRYKGDWYIRKVFTGANAGESIQPVFFFFFLFKIVFIFRASGREGEREGEKHQYVVASHEPHTGDLACNPGMCPEWESNQRPFGLQAGTQSTEPHQPGLKVLYESSVSFLFLKKRFYLFILERGGRKEKERERNMCERNRDQLPLSPPNGDLVCNPGMCPNWESNQRPFSLQAGTQSTEPHQPGVFLNKQLKINIPKSQLQGGNTLVPFNCVLLAFLVFFLA